MTVPMGLVAAAGEESSQMTFNGRDFEDWHRSGWDPAYRLNDQARDGVAAELLFATVGMQLCGHADLDYRRACMAAYNRWLQEYCSFAPDRLFGAGQAAVKNAADAVDELAEIKKHGVQRRHDVGSSRARPTMTTRLTIGCGPRRSTWSCRSASTSSPIERTAVTAGPRSTRY